MSQSKLKDDLTDSRVEEMLSDMSSTQKQRLLLQIISKFNLKSAIRDIDAKIEVCAEALDLVETNKLILTQTMKVLRDQKATTYLIGKKYEQIEHLKVFNQFPEDEKLAVHLMDFYLSEFKLRHWNSIRQHSVDFLLRESDRLSVALEHQSSNQFSTNETLVFLQIDSLKNFAIKRIAMSEKVDLWGCVWKFAMKMNKSQKLRSRLLADGSGYFLSFTLYCEPPKCNTSFQYVNTTLNVQFTIIDKSDIKQSVTQTVSAEFLGSKSCSWSAEDVITWERLRSNWKTWTMCGSLLLQCKCKLSQ